MSPLERLTFNVDPEVAERIKMAYQLGYDNGSGEDYNALQLSEQAYYAKRVEEIRNGRHFIRGRDGSSEPDRKA
jgi:hypothetical protein